MQGANDKLQPTLTSDNSGLHVLHCVRNNAITLSVMAANGSLLKAVQGER